METLFKLKNHHTSIKKELIAGATSFFASVYIIVVNGKIISDSGVPLDPLIIATIFASFSGCILVALISNTPLIIMPGMGINALFTYTLVNTLGLTFNEALFAVFISGILFLIIASTSLSDILSNSIPTSLKQGITVGIGLFITFLGLQKGGLITGDSVTLLKLGDISSLSTITFLLTLIITLFMFLKNIKAGFLISIIFGCILSFILGVLQLPSSYISTPNLIEYREILFSFNLNSLTSPSFWIGVFSLTLVLVFENIGLLHGQIDGMLKAPTKSKKALISIALSCSFCGLLGTSPSVSTVEGTSGITAGGRTGLTSIFTGILFLLSLFFIPVIASIPDVSYAPILLIIGALMISHISEIKFDDFSEVFPAFLIITLIPLTFSIIDGMAFGFIAYPICKLFKKKTNKISFPMFLISIIFLVYLVIFALGL